MDFWIVDFRTSASEIEAAMFEERFLHVIRHVKDTRTEKRWWLHERPRPQLRIALNGLPRFILTVRVSKHRLFIWRSGGTIPDTATVAITRADNTTFGILHSRFHELRSLRMGTWLGVGNDPRYTPTTCFETFPFPPGLTPADTAHQQTEQVEGGALIPASEPAPPGQQRQSLNLRSQAIQIATGAKKLNDLRENWLNPPEWTHKVPKVTPLGLDKSPYPDRIEPKPGISEADLKALQKRTFTNLYNAKPAWLSMAHQQLDQAVAAAYDWTDYTPAMPDDEILKRLLALNLARSAMTSGDNEAHMDCGSGPQ